MDTNEPKKTDLFNSDRRTARRPGDLDRRLYSRPSPKLKLYGIIGATLFAAILLVLFTFVWK